MKKVQTTQIHTQYACEHCGKKYDYQSSAEICEQKCVVKKALDAGLKTKFSVGDVVLYEGDGDYYSVEAVGCEVKNGVVVFYYTMDQRDGDGYNYYIAEAHLRLVYTAADLQQAIDAFYTECSEKLDGVGQVLEVELDFETGKLKASVYREVHAGRN